MTIVLDASALVTSLVGRSAPADALRRRLVAETCHAPHLIDAEVGNVLRRLVLRQELAAPDAGRLLHNGAALIDYRHPMTGPLAEAAWRLRSNLSFYDAVYVALAAALATPLLTADSRSLALPVSRAECSISTHDTRSAATGQPSGLREVAIA